MASGLGGTGQRSLGAAASRQEWEQMEKDMFPGGSQPDKDLRRRWG
jgi:hypothetical protein